MSCFRQDHNSHLSFLAISAQREMPLSLPTSTRMVNPTIGYICTFTSKNTWCRYPFKRLIQQLTQLVQLINSFRCAIYLSYWPQMFSDDKFFLSNQGSIHDYHNVDFMRCPYCSQRLRSGISRKNRRQTFDSFRCAMVPISIPR